MVVKKFRFLLVCVSAGLSLFLLGKGASADVSAPSHLNGDAQYSEPETLENVWEEADMEALEDIYISPACQSFLIGGIYFYLCFNAPENEPLLNG